MTQWFSADQPINALPLDDRGLQYGDGIFETVAIRDGLPRNLDLHLQRLANGCEKLHLQVPTDLRQQLIDALNQSVLEADNAVAKIIITAGSGERGYGRAPVAVPKCFIGVFAAQPLPASLYQDGVDLIRCSTELGLNSPIAGIKTLNRLEQVLARSEVLVADSFEGLTMDANQDVVSGTMSNVFFVRGKRVLTPDLSKAGIAGTMRRFIINELEKQGLPVEETEIAEDEVVHMNEAFLCNSQFGIVPVQRYCAHVFNSSSHTRNVMALMASRGIRECTQ